MTDLIREIVADDREKRSLDLYRKFLPIVILVSVLIVIFMIWREYSTDKMENYRHQASDEFLKTLHAHTSGEAKNRTLKNLISNKNTKIKELAAVKLLDYKALNMVEHYQELKLLIDDSRYSPLVKAYSTLNYIGRLLDKQDLQQQDINFIVQELSEFSKVGSPLRGLAYFYNALWQYRNNDLATCSKIIKEILEGDFASEEVKEQAKILNVNIQLLGKN